MKAFELLRRVEMGLIRTFLGFSGFGIGVSAGLVIGCYLFIYFQPTDVKDPIIRPLVERDSETFQSLLPEKPLWVITQILTGVCADCSAFKIVMRRKFHVGISQKDLHIR